MSLKLLERVRMLALSLSVEEKNFLVSYIDASNNKVNYESKLLAAFKSVSSPNPKSKDPNKDSRKSLELIEDKILDSLLTDLNLTRKSKFADNPYCNLVLGKESMKVRVLTLRGSQKRAFELAQSLIKQSNKIERYDLSSQLILNQLSITSAFHDPELFKEKTDELNRVEYLQGLLSKSTRYFLEIKMRKHLAIRENYDLFIKETLVSLTTLSEKTSSQTIEFILTFVKKESLLCNGLLHEALSLSIDLYSKLDLLTDPAFCSVHEVMLDHAQICLELNRSHEGLFLLKKITQSTLIDIATKEQANTIKFLAYYLNHDYLNAFNIILENKSNQPKSTSPTHQNRWIYFEACVLFQNGQYLKVIKLIKSSDLGKKESLKEKIKYRFLLIAALIELDKYDLADNELESLRKFIFRNNLTNSNEFRFFQKLYNALNCLKRNGYMLNCMKEANLKIQKQSLNPMSFAFDLAFLYHWINVKLKGNQSSSETTPKWTDSRVNQFYETGTIQPIYSYY